MKIIRINYYFIFTLLLIVFDQITKLLIYGFIKPHDSIVINDFLSLSHVHNYGLVFWQISLVGSAIFYQASRLLLVLRLLFG